MDGQELLNQYHKCLYKETPPCSGACPLGIDVRGFIGKVKSGLFSAAYKLFVRDAVLGGIVCHLCAQPCGEVCARRRYGGAVSLRELERFCWQQAARRPRGSFYIPEKDKRILVVGASLCGVSCAVKLAQRGYAVHLVEKSGRLGGSVWGVDETRLSRRVLEGEFEGVMELGFLTVSLHTEVRSLEDYAFDAALDATGGALALPERPGLFTGGRGLDARHWFLHAIREGADLSYLMENYIKIGKMERPAPRPEGCLFYPQVQEIRAVPAVRPADPAAWTAEEARAEAERCLLCHCDHCTNVCDMLAWYHADPQKTLLDVSDTLGKTVLNNKSALRKIMGCSQCGLCGNHCPEGIDFKEIFVESRRIMHRSGDLPDALYDFWLDDMAFSNGDRASLFRLPKNNPQPRFLFFPGCQMGASDPGYVSGAYARLLERFPDDVGIFLYCCGAPAYWAGNEALHADVTGAIRAKWEESGRPAVILGCPTCGEMFSKHLPEICTVSLWEIWEQDAAAPEHENERIVSVFDPCASKYDGKAQRAVRALLRGAGYTIEELPSAGKEARCCGYGGLSAAGSAGAWESVREKNAQLGPRDYVTYCTNCRDRLSMDGKPCLHLLDVLLYPGDAGRWRREPPGLMQRRDNREALRRALVLRLDGAAAPIEPLPHESIRLLVPEALREGMERERVLEDNLKKCIFHAGQTGEQIYNPHSGSFTCHRRLGAVTFWVTYRPAGKGGDCFEVLGFYTHRMQIEEGTV